MLSIFFPILWIGALLPVRTAAFATIIPAFAFWRQGAIMQLNLKRTTSSACLYCNRPESLVSLSSSSSIDNQDIANDDSRDEITRLTVTDLWLSRLTTAFPMFVVAAAVIGGLSPSSLLWVNRGPTVTLMLASVMCGTGLTLETKDFTAVLDQSKMAIPLGVVSQFSIMPLTAWAVGDLLLKPEESALRATLFLGLVLVGCSPGGTASNLVSLIAGADVALSVILTSCSTMAAVVMTPLLAKLLVGSSIKVSGWALCAATAKVVLLPVLLGMILKARAPALTKAASRFTPFASVLLVSLICGGVVAQTAPLLSAGIASGGSVGLPLVLSSVFLLHLIGFAAGYIFPKLLSAPEKSARTISIEVGMQNSALAVVLARTIPGVHPAASLPGALSATTHSCLGSILAAVWRLQASRDKSKEEAVK